MATTRSKHRATEVTPDKIVIDWESAWQSAANSHKLKLTERFNALKKDGWVDIAEAAKLLGYSVDYTRDILACSDLYEECTAYNGKTNIKLWRPKTPSGQ
jgi:hypothetical protein